MRLLFYTATAFFIVLAGVFIFYAVDGPEQSGGSKIVLSIDSRAAPGEAAPGASEPERDLYAEAAARLKRTEGDKPQGTSEIEATAASDALDPNGERIVSAQEQQDAPTAEHRDAAASGTAATAGLPTAAEAPSGQDSALPTSTSLAGLDQDKPQLKTVEQSDGTPSGLDEPAATSAETAALPGTQSAALPGTRLTRHRRQTMRLRRPRMSGKRPGVPLRAPVRTIMPTGRMQAMRAPAALPRTLRACVFVRIAPARAWPQPRVAAKPMSMRFWRH